MASSDGRKNTPPNGLDRLPPPAFPPGSRRNSAALGRSTANDAVPPLQDVLPAGAFISPDDPIRPPSDVPDDAFISPDEPIRHRPPLPGKPPAREAARVEVTGIGESDPSYYRSVTALANDVRDVEGMAHVLEELAKRMKEDGAAALIGEPGIPAFEAAVRGFLAGYLARTRAGD